MAVPVANTMKPVKILCLDIQFWMFSSVEVEIVTIGGGGGGRGRMDSGTQDEPASRSRRPSAIFSTFWSI